MRHLKKFESSIDERIRYQEMIEDFVQDIRDEDYEVFITDQTKSAHTDKNLKLSFNIRFIQFIRMISIIYSVKLTNK